MLSSQRFRSTVTTCNDRASSEQDSEIINLYKKVAEEDSEWFEDFVVNILGEDQLSEDLAVLVQETKNGKGNATATSRQTLSTKKESSTGEIRKTPITIDDSIAKQTDAFVVDDDVHGAVLEDVNAIPGGNKTDADKIIKDGGNSTTSLQSEPQDTGVDSSSSSFNSGAGFGTSSTEGKATSKSFQTIKAAEGTSTIDPPDKHPELSRLSTKMSNDQNQLSSFQKEPRINQTTTSNDGGLATELDAKVEATMEQDEGLTVLYMESLSNEWKKVPLVSLEALGYNQSDIKLMQPDALDLIVEDEIEMPRNGVPPQWNLPEARIQEAPKFMTTKEAEKFLSLNNISTIKEDTSSDEQSRRKGPRERKRRKAPSSSADPRQHTRGDRSRKQNKSRDSPLIESDSRRQALDTEQKVKRSSPPHTSRHKVEIPDTIKSNQFGRDSSYTRPNRSQFRSDGSRKPVYSGRQASSLMNRRDDDPPPPKSGLWPDIDSFRDMLRNEARLRIRILGDDWSDIVKEESDWRLSLYKSWLWTLHNGVGDPIVESRSDRMRRSRRTGPDGGLRDADPRRPRRARRPKTKSK